jgi:hypothetical protein
MGTGGECRQLTASGMNQFEAHDAFGFVGHGSNEYL